MALLALIAQKPRAQDCRSCTDQPAADSARGADEFSRATIRQHRR
jgi:hypothetical protein